MDVQKRLRSVLLCCTAKKAFSTGVMTNVKYELHKYREWAKLFLFVLKMEKKGKEKPPTTS